MSVIVERSSEEFEPPRIPPNVHPMLLSPRCAGEREFPVERVAVAFRAFLEAMDLDLKDPNLAGTEHRVARAYQQMLGGLGRAEPELNTFPNTERCAGTISVTNIPFYSICAHHFLPFFGTAHVAYVPRERLVGLSKITRVVDFYSRRPQLQENLTEETAMMLDERLAPAGLIVSTEARHLCMEMRGVSRPGVTTTTTAVRGTFQDEGLQQQFFARIRGPGAAVPTREA
jgi:GTP cyclohydrolase I